MEQSFVTRKEEDTSPPDKTSPLHKENRLKMSLLLPALHTPKSGKRGLPATNQALLNSDFLKTYLEKLLCSQ